jgi:K+-transporting ATPase ATPase A chain
VLEGQKTFLDPVLRPIERLLYRACGVHADQEMSWQQYTVAMLIFSFVSLLLTYIIERAQGFLLPWNPQHLAGVAPAPPSTPRHRSPPTPTGRSTRQRPP